MAHPHPYILDLSEDELASYNIIIQTLAERPYRGEHITEQVVNDIRMLAESNQSTASVAQRLINLLQDDLSVPHLIAALSERSLSYPAALILGWFGPRAHSAVRALIEAIGWGPTIGVGAAATALERIGGDPTPLLDGLTRSLQETNDDAFVQLLGVAIDMGLYTDSRFIAILNAATRNPNATIRERTAEAIGVLPEDIRLRLDDAIARLKADHDYQVQKAIKTALER